MAKCSFRIDMLNIQHNMLLPTNVIAWMTAKAELKNLRIYLVFRDNIKQKHRTYKYAWCSGPEKIRLSVLIKCSRIINDSKNTIEWYAKKEFNTHQR